MSGAWSVYILRCADATLYTGITNRIAVRVDAHNGGRGARYTRGRLPVELVYEEAVGDRAAALRREAEIKRLPAAAKRRLVAGSGGGGNAGRGPAGSGRRVRSVAQYPE